MGRLLFLASMGASVVFLPQQLKGLMSSLPLPAPGLQSPALSGAAGGVEGFRGSPGEAQQALQSLQSELGQSSLANAVGAPNGDLSQLAKLGGQAGGNANLDSLPIEERELHQASSREVELLSNPLLAKLLEMSRPGAQSQSAGPGLLAQNLPDPSKLLEFVEVWKPRLTAGAWGFCLGLVALAAFFMILDQKGLSRLLCGLVHGLTGWWLWGVSLAAAGAYLTAQLNLWNDLPSELWAAPAAGLLASAGLLRTLDMNAPVWNGTFLSLLAPIASCLFIAGTGILKGFA